MTALGAPDATSRPPEDAATGAQMSPPIAPDAGSSATAQEAGRRDAGSLMSQYEEPTAPTSDAGRRTLQTEYQ